MTRAIPVVALDTISGAPTETMLGKALKATHDTYRRELARIRTEVATSGAGVGAQLRINCLTMCQGIHQHHTGEDTRIFPSVHKEHPELAPLLERLSRDHQKVQRILDSLQGVVSTNQPSSAQVLTEVERLIAELEAHLDYEEAHLLPTLDTVPL